MVMAPNNSNINNSKSDHTGQIIRVLGLILNQPNRREQPLENDLDGHYSFWFDGGAGLMNTGGGTHYYFVDGSIAHQPYSWEPGYPGVSITFADGQKVIVSYENK